MTTGMSQAVAYRSPRGSAVRVLVVDDEVNLATAIQRGLTAEGFSVDVVYDGEEAVWAATEQA